MVIKPGMLVASRFRVVRLAGSGGMGSVFLARDETSATEVALKLLLPRGTPENVRFIREARILSTLEHPGIVGYVAHGVSDTGEPYLAMEWVQGETLEDKLRHGALEIDTSVQICLQVARALGAAHRRGVIHRDIKPSNIMCLPDGTVKVVDFGVATGGATNTPSTVAGRFVGTPGYIAPEQARGVKTLDGRADLFSLGGVLYICLTGSPAFPGEHMLAILAKVVLDDPPRVSELCEGVPPQLERLVTSMLSKAPELRPVDAESVAEELEGVLDSLARVDSRMPVSRQVLTRREMQVVSVVVAATYLHETIDCDASTQDPRLREMPELLESLGVTLERLIDGSFLCVVRTGEAATDQAVRASRAALALHKAHPDIPIIVATGRGVFSGKLPVGEVIERAVAALREHHATRAGAAPQSSAWGPPSSRWRHLESASPESTGVQIDSLTAGLLDARFDVRADEHALWLFGEHERVDPVRTLLGQRVPFVGREREIAFLEATITQSVDEDVSRVVLVTADAGSGKSRLLSEFLTRVSQRSPRVEIWNARGSQVSQGSPFGLIAKMIRAISAVEESDTPLVHRRKIEARVRRCVADAQVDRVSEFLAELCAVGRESGESELIRAARRDAQVMADQIARAWSELVVAECASGPLLLAIDDLQWSDFSSIKLLDAALRRVKDRPVVIVACARPNVREVFPELWSLREVEAIHLSKLPARACERLARSVLSDLGSSQISNLVERADGNPFFLEELLRAAVFGKLGVLPDTVVAMAQSRLDTQPPESRRALRAASVFGDTFWLSPLKMMLDQEAAEPLEIVLDNLVRDELIEPRGEVKYRGEVAYAFRHVLVRDAAYAALTDRDRSLAHRIAARWLEEQGEPDVAQIAWHAEKGGLIAQAIRGYLRAAEQALAGNDLQAVVQRCEQAACLGASGEDLGYARFLACAAHKWRGEFSEAERRGSEALTLLARGARWYTNAGELGVALGILGHRQRVVELAMLVIANDETGATRTAQCVAAARLVAQLLFAGERVVGTRILTWVEEAMLAVGDVDPVARAQLLLARGIQCMFEGDAAACIAMMEASAACSEQAGDLRRACAARINVASAAIELGGYDVSAALLLNLLEPAESLGLATLISDVHQNLGLALARLGRFDEAIAHESLALSGYTSRGQPREAAVSRSYFAQILALSGQWLAAEHEARAAIESLSAVSPRRAYALAILAEIVLHAGRADDAHAAALEASGILEVLGGLDEGEALVRLSYAKSLYAIGRFDAACEAIVAARARLDERASKISDPTWRRSFVELVGENVQTLQLAQAWASGW